ncbi:MAG TPA: diaminopimelate epimerase [Thermoanaerobaculia bacterium]|nr:diaminopimelate epimerase [Thermoanaerobaculia bacterium]
MTAFFKVSGGGNDFLALPEPAAPPAAEQIRAWCRRGVSLGADGLFVLRRGARADGGRVAGGAAAVAGRADGGTAAAGGAGPAAAESNPVEMDYFNADGREADLCLNGTRCAAQLAFHLGWAGGRAMVLTAAGPFTARRLDDRSVVLELPPPEAPAELGVDLDGHAHRGWRLTVGVPHFVLHWPADLESAPVVALGRPLRHHQSFQPAGTNVDFVRFPSPHQMEIRTYERGVEAETLACGTGVLAGAAVGLTLGRAALPLTAATRGGFALTVDRAPAGGGWTLAGDARLVASGHLLPGADPPQLSGADPAH